MSGIHDSGSVNTIPPPGEESRGGELVPVGAYGLAPQVPAVWYGPSAPRPEMLTAGPDPLSLLRAYMRRWFLATGLGLLAAMAACTAGWFLIPEKGNVVAAIRVHRHREGVLDAGRQQQSTFDFSMIRNIVKQDVRSRPVLMSALRDPAVSQLPVVKQQDDPIVWLENELRLDYPGDAELLVINMSGEETAQLVTIVNAVIDKYFKEVVEKDYMAAEQRERELNTELESKVREYESQQKSMRQLQAAAGNTDPDAVRVQQDIVMSEVHNERARLANTEMQIHNLDIEIRKAELDIELAKDPNNARAKIEKELKNDRTIQNLEEQLAYQNLMIGDLQNISKGAENSSLKRAYQQRAKLQEKIEERKNELVQEFGQYEQKLNVAEFEAKLGIAKKAKEEMQKQAEILRKHMNELKAEAEKLAKQSAEVLQSKERLKTLENFITKLEDEKLRLGLERTRRPQVDRFHPALEPEGKDSMTKYKLMGVAGLGAFLAVGLAVSYLEFLSRRISSSTQLAQGLGMRVVGALPSISRSGRKRRSMADMNNVLIESIDTVRTNLMHSAAKDKIQVVMVTSALDREGKTTVASQLAASLARCGRRAILIDGDLRRPTAHRLFELPLEPGVCEVLRGECEIDDVIRPTRIPGLWMISAGQYDLESIQALSRQKIGEIFEMLRARFEFVVLDSAPVLSIADASMLGQHVDAAILCVMRDVSQATKVYEASEQLRSVGIRVLGAVINGERTSATYRAYAASRKG